MRKKIFIVLIVLFVAQLFFRIYTYRSDYLTPYNAKYWEYRYLHSQWVVENSKMSIGDDGVYMYAGWEYIHGRDPTTLNAELPPFGKYLIGISEVVFNNQNIFSLVTGLLALGAFYLLNTIFFKDKLLAFIPVLLFSCEQLFYEQLQTTMLDSLYLLLLLLTFYFFFRKQFFVSATFLGLMAATKSSITTFALVIFVTVAYMFLAKQMHLLKKYIVSLSVAVLAFLATYLQYFLDGHSLRAFLGVQKYIVTFYAIGAKGSLITPWEMIFTGKWHTWWRAYIPVNEWHIGWIVLFLLSVFSLCIMVISRYKNPLLLIAIWLLVYLVFLSFIPTWPRYLLLVLPFLYNLSIWIITQVSSTKYKFLRINKK